jgi:hypothetical protein
MILAKLIHPRKKMKDKVLEALKYGHPTAVSRPRKIRGSIR